MDGSLPFTKLTAHFQDFEAAKLYILNKISSCEECQKINICKKQVIAKYQWTWLCNLLVNKGAVELIQFLLHLNVEVQFLS